MKLVSDFRLGFKESENNHSWPFLFFFLLLSFILFIISYQFLIQVSQHVFFSSSNTITIIIICTISFFFS